MHHDKNTSTKFVAEFVGEERETAPAAAPVRAAELSRTQRIDHKHRKHGGGGEHR
jgi:hypothetical protein